MPICLFAAVKVAIIGDSISVGHGATQGHGCIEELKLRFERESKDIELINRSYGGAMTDTVLQITCTLLTQEKPDYIVFFIGINDCGIALNQGWTNTALRDHLINNLSNAFRISKGNCKGIILGGITCPFNSNYNEALGDTYSILVANYNAYPTMLLGPKVLANCPDGFHPNDKGAKMIAELLYSALDKIGAYKLEKENAIKIREEQTSSVEQH